MKESSKAKTVLVKAVMISLIYLFTFSPIFAQGIAFIHNFTAQDYHGQNINFDVIADQYGNIFIANFEGLMYYDHANWRILHTPGITRITVVEKTSDNTIWVGGYNYFGKVSRKPNGELFLERIGSPDQFQGEVLEIYEKDGELLFIVNNGNIYLVKDGKISIKEQVDKDALRIGVTDVVNVKAIEKGEKDVILNDVIIEEDLDNGQKAIVKKGEGIVITDVNGAPLYSITEENGLCTNNISYIAYDGRGQVWGATDKGVFVIQIPSAFSRFTPHEGITGEVISLERFQNKMYAGTAEGLFCLDGKRFVRIPALRHSCWDLKSTSAGLMAATSEGVFLLKSDGNVRKLTEENSLAVLGEETQFYSCETDGVYVYSSSGLNKHKICDLSKAKKIIKDKEGTIWVQNLYGQVWYKTVQSGDFQKYNTSDNSMSTIVEADGKVFVVNAASDKPFSYPLYSFVDDSGVSWLTNNEGKKLYRWKDGKRLNDMNNLLLPIHDIPVRSLYHHGNELWIGNDDGITVINTGQKDYYLGMKPEVRFQSVKLNNDSVLWGGFGNMPKFVATLNHSENNLYFTFSLNYTPLVGKTLYRYRMDNGNWSAWSTNTYASFINMIDGDHTFSVQARDVVNRETEIASISFSITPPFYRQWYMYLLYAIIASVLLYILYRIRVRKLEKDKLRLEKVIQARTAEVVKQKDEIEEKSKSLETALKDLGEAQHELIRQEKMATVGKLTQGLIDRILNPLNYINNFSKLSEGLIKDVKTNIEDEKEHMDEENYEDTMDVLDMLTGNLQKVSEHGLNTTRTLKAMEEMLKDRSGGIISMNLSTVIKQDEEMLKEYFKNEIAANNIKTVFDYPEVLQLDGNPEQLSKTIMCILGNSIYAVVKKARKTSFKPEVSLRAFVEDGDIRVIVHDNGIGIENTIIDKIFDPFFTTKTTGEAAGVGLYLSREIVQNYGGDITAKSVKGEFTEFTITLPNKRQ